MSTHLLVTNDFPPKIGGIQSYLWELWRRLPPESFVVYTTPHRDAVEWDAAQPFRIIRSREPWLGPYPWLASRVDTIADGVGASLVLLDPALPLGHIGPDLRHPYGVVLHGAEVTVPGRLPGSRALLARVLEDARLVVAAGGYPADEGVRAVGHPLPTCIVPPGVDTLRFVPLSDPERVAARVRLGLPAHGPLIVSVSRLVPRKGMDTLIRAAARLRPSHPDLVVAIAGRGRDTARLQRLAATTGAPVRFLGRVDDTDLPALFGCGDVFSMLCRVRWAGLEQEGFGIVFLEAAACGVPQIAGRSGGAHEAVEHDATGLVIDDPTDERAVAAACAALLADPARRHRFGHEARARAVEQFDYDVLAARLRVSIDSTCAAIDAESRQSPARREDQGR